MGDFLPGDFESMFIKAGDSETSKGLEQKEQQERDLTGPLGL